MTSVCLIGNSHVGALKLGWPEIEAQFPGFTLDFYATAGQSMELEVHDGRLVPATEPVRKRLAVTSGKNGDIEAGYDAYVVCGLTLSAMRALHAYNTRFTELRQAGRHKTAGIEDFAPAMELALRGAIAVDVAAKLRRITQAPVFLIATPYGAHVRHEHLWERLSARGHDEIVERAYDMACRKIAGESSVTFVPQPAETVDSNGFTTREAFFLFPLDYVRNERAEHTHMNAAFGAIVLRDVLEKARAALA
jgi:hypothetical protein